MINGGVLSNSAGTSGSPVRSSPCTFSAPWVRGHGAAARQAAEASAAGLSGRVSVSGRLVQGIRRRALYGCSSGRTHPFTSSRKQSGTASPAVVTSPAGPSSALMQMMMPRVSVETLAFDGLSSHAALLKEAPMVRACLLVLLARVQNWEEVFLRLHAINKSTLIAGRPEVGKATFLRRFCAFFAPALVRVGGRHCRWPNGKLGSDCEGQTYHSFSVWPSVIACTLHRRRRGGALAAAEAVGSDYRPTVAFSSSPAGRHLRHARCDTGNHARVSAAVPARDCAAVRRLRLWRLLAAAATVWRTRLRLFLLARTPRLRDA